MTKRRLSDQQKARIESNQQSALNDATYRGIVVKRFRQDALVQLDNGDRILAAVRQTLAQIVPGDRVALDQEKDFIVRGFFPRTSLLKRESRFGKEKLIAANITQMLIVMAVVPESGYLLLDSYLLAASILGVKPLIVVNKMDLADDRDALNARFALYKTLGFPIIYTSQSDEQSVKQLIAYLANETSIFVGQSGVGKSSLLSAILPDAEIEIGEISDKQQLGRHTTSVSEYFQLGEGAVIDSPGVREFMLSQYTEQDLIRAFPEFNNTQGQCQFRNCSHLDEPSCIFHQMLDNHQIALSRFDSFIYLLKRVNQ